VDAKDAEEEEDKDDDDNHDDEGEDTAEATARGARWKATAERATAPPLLPLPLRQGRGEQTAVPATTPMSATP
jgi:hypothetical protein